MSEQTPTETAPNHPVVTGLYFVLYALAISGGVLLYSGLTSEYFPGGDYWTGPILSLLIPISASVLHFVARIKKMKTTGLWAVTLLSWVLFVGPMFMIHHYFWVIEHRIQECGVYETPCDEVNNLEY